MHFTVCCHCCVSSRKYSSATPFDSHSNNYEKSSTSFDIQNYQWYIVIKCGLISKPAVMEWGWEECLWGRLGRGWTSVGMGGGRDAPLQGLYPTQLSSVPGAPIKNNPLEKILYLRNCSRFFFTRFILFTEEDLGHVYSKLHLNIWFDSKIITIWT